MANSPQLELATDHGIIPQECTNEGRALFNQKIMSKRAEKKAWDWSVENKVDPYSMGQAYAIGYEQAEKDLKDVLLEKVNRAIELRLKSGASEYSDGVMTLSAIKETIESL